MVAASFFLPSRPHILSFQKEIFSFLLISIFTPSITSILSFSAPKGELLEPPNSEHPILASSYELRPDLNAMV